jgi:hypothetical protein
MLNDLSLCDDPTQPYRVGTYHDWSWFTPGEKRRFGSFGVVTIVHPLDPAYPHHSWVGGHQRLPEGASVGDKEPPRAIYTYVSFKSKLGHYNGIMDLPRGQFRHVSWCASCESYFEGRNQYLCPSCDGA